MMTSADTPVSADALTLEEQVALLAGRTFCEVPGVERLGIRSLKVSDGPNGARGAGSFTSGTPAASFPVGIALASTWNRDLVFEIGVALGQEAHTKGAQVILGPTVNIHRHPLGGRNFESFSEDPWLAGVLGIAIVEGLQSRSVSACVKHFTGNESEFERHTIDSVIGERALRELYLRPFEMIVRQAAPWCVMCSYNKLNGTYASENHRLLTEILRDEWGFDGVVMSDWTATQSTGPAIDAGLDIEMPGPPRWRGEKLIAAVTSGEASRSSVQDSAQRVLTLIERTALAPSVTQEEAIDRPDHRALIRTAGGQGIVLLRNNGLLPIDPATVRSIAVIGPNAATAQIMGGGSSQINAHYRISPLDGIATAFPEAQVVHARGCLNTRLLPVLEEASTVEMFSNPDLAGEPVATQVAPNNDHMWLGFIHPGVEMSSVSMRFSTSLTARIDGVHDLGIVSAGPVRVYVDGQLTIDYWDTWDRGGEFFGLVSKEIRAELDLRAGEHHDVRIETRSPFGPPYIGVWMVRLGFDVRDRTHELEAAVEAAGASDLAIVCIGLNGEWDTEGYDRPHMDLPGRQNELVARVAAANPNTVVVLQTGGPVRMPWLDDVSAVMQAWYPGQECGNAIADVVGGIMTPSGKLPCSWPYEVEQNPAHIGYPGERGRNEYREGIFAGYRGYDARKVEPLFPFGYGLSYTHFTYGATTASEYEIAPGETVEVSVEIANSGDRHGAEIVQFYVEPHQHAIERPVRELKGFARVELASGEAAQASTALDMRSFAYFDDLRNAWVADAGEYTVHAAASSSDLRSSVVIRLTGEWIERAEDAHASAHI